MSNTNPTAPQPLRIRKQISTENVGELGTLLRYIRERQKVTVKKLGEEIGRTSKQIHRYEMNQVAIPSDILTKWLDALGYKWAITQ